jgi:hypothetical protein
VRVSPSYFGQFLKNFQKYKNIFPKTSFIHESFITRQAAFSVKDAHLITGELGIVIKIPRSENG